MRRKGELSPAAIDREWPHQIALSASACKGGGYMTIHEFCKELSLCPRGHTVAREGQWFNVYCFAKPEDVDKFRERFGGEKFDPKQRRKGSNWARLKKHK